METNIFYLNKINHGEEQSFSLKSYDGGWPRDTIFEVNESELHEHEPNLEAELSIKKIKNTEFKDHIIISGSISASYTTPCVRCLTEAVQHVSGDFNACFIDSHFEKQEEYIDLEFVYTDGKECDLYFFEQGKLDLAQLLYEQVMVLAPMFPLHSEDCKGLCPECGINLNESSCSHRS